MYAYPQELAQYKDPRQKLAVLLTDLYYVTQRFEEAVHMAQRLLKGQFGALSSAQRDYIYFATGASLAMTGDRRGALEAYDHVLAIPTPAQIPIIRRVYEKEYKDKPLTSPSTGKPMMYCCGVRSSGHYMLVLLNKLGDPKALEEVHAAVSQKKDAQRKVWGMMLASQMRDKTALPMIAQALDDKNTVQESVYQGSDFEVPGASHAWRRVYTRVCDMALRAIYTIDPPAEPWSFSVAKGDFWRWGSDPVKEYFQYTTTISKGWQKANENDEHEVVLNSIIAGFTDEQIEIARKYGAQRVKEYAKPGGGKTEKAPAN